MPKPSITEYEISIIKAMLARDMRNKDIQFFFNRPERPVNSGRITGIKNGTYSNSKTIKPATEESLNKFLSETPNASEVGGILVPAEGTMTSLDPISESEIRKLFEQNADGYWVLTHGETDYCEAKRNFGFKYPEAWLRAVAALANNAGGYVLFGVCDKGTNGTNGEDHSHYVCGMDDDLFLDADAAEFSMRLKSFFQPTPRFEITSISFDDKVVGVLFVHKHPSAPVIATTGGKSKIKEGDIFYRYPGQSTRIKYGDLRSILDDRDKKARLESLPLIEKILEIGPEKSMIADLTNGLLSNQQNNIFIDDDAIGKLKFIKEGQFVEKDGALTLKLIGELQPINYVKTKQVFDNISKNEIFSCFLNQVSVDNPAAFINALRDIQTYWLPIFYYQHLAQFSEQQAVDCLNDGIGGMKQSIRHHTNRLKSRSGPNLNAYGSDEFRQSLKNNVNIDVYALDLKDKRLLLRSLQELNKDDIELEYALTILKQFYPEIFIDSPTIQSEIRKAICWVDAIYYA